MPVYQVTLTYLITVEGEIDAEDAVIAATNIVQENPEIYNDVEIERVDKPKCCGLRAHTCVVDEVIGPSDLYEDRMHLSGIKDYIGTLESFKDYLKEHKAQQEKILNTLKKRLGEEGE